MERPCPTKADAVVRIHCSGELLTPDEWLRYVAEKMESDGRADLLRNYINW